VFYVAGSFVFDGREHNFLFAREGAAPDERLPGTYTPDRREEIRRGWDQLVEIRAIVTEHRLLRHAELMRIELEFLELLAVVGEPE
jgi:hypothetical protein